MKIKHDRYRTMKRRRQAYDMRVSGMTWAAIGSCLGCSKRRARELANLHLKMTNTGVLARPAQQGKSIEELNDEN